MKLAVISVTSNGAILARHLADVLNIPIDVYARVGRNPVKADSEFDSLSELVAKIFYQYDGLIFIMAAGIVVRVIAPHVRDKRYDPAVVVMDEAGDYAISLLSGHIGGANELTQKVARAVGAKAVITTATDVAQKPAPDVLAVKLDLMIDPWEELKHINAAIVQGERVTFFLDPSLPNAQHYDQVAEEMGIHFVDMAHLNRVEEYDAAVVITDKDLYMVKRHVYLRPATLAVGIGCRRGTTSAEIFAALDDACKKVGRTMKSVAVIGTTVVKQEEIGILAAVQQMVIPLELYTNEQLQQCIDDYGLPVSGFVQEKIGVGNICEAAALLGGQTDKLLLPKTVYQNLTIAIAEVKYPSWESAPVI
ncbi:cobalamin biosynthesis central region [Lucifera butyrica]|uniref:Cobalamin biosynthesis central region n=1 Tax=Lucifera butyrica TaxID=1351585 RepID=A0A498RCF9_9FIRM|nr:cobalt-precorrin 5A hydrolase [Lucifera butyrica]VBB06838.1 cobalamin biosynthesis central region [Lucifera butyrica]